MASRCILFILLLILGGFLAAQSGHEDPVVYADHKTIGEEALRAAGHVEVFWQDYVIFADAIDFNLKSRELFAEGRVTMATKNMSLSGEKLFFNLKTQKGELTDTYGLLSPLVRCETDRLQQTDRNTLRFAKMTFTSCAQIRPRWTIRSRKGRIRKEKYVAMRDAVLRIKKIPIFYLPYLRYPIPEDGRATGLLVPAVGISNLRGFFVQNAFFWAIRPNIDATLGVDYFSKLGVGASDELRYLFRKAEGSARFYYFKYRKDNGVYNDTESDYYVNADHQQTLPFLNSRLVLNVDRQSRPGFLRLMDNSFDRRLLANFQTSLSLTSSLANMRTTLGASRQETYNIGRDRSDIIEYLPSLSFNLNQQKLGKLPGYLSLGIDFANMRRSGMVVEEGEPVFARGVFSKRLVIGPSYRIPLLQIPWLNSALNLSSQNVFYDKSLDPETHKAVNEPLGLKYHEVDFNLQGPVFYRIFGGGKLKHVIEPEFSCRYAAREDDADRVIKVDLSDYPSYTRAGFSLTSRLLAKGGAAGVAPRDIFAYTISQVYYVDAAEANRFLKINGEYPKFSELGNRLRFQPVANLSLDAAAAYNYYINGFSRLNLSAAYTRPGAPLSGSLSFSIQRNPYTAKDYDLNRSLLMFAGRVDIPGFPVKLQTNIDYDFTLRELRYGSLIATFDYQCLLFRTEFKVFDHLGRSERQFRFGVSFGNLGAAGDFFGNK